jgi:HAD superfamily hydrolase (TIGR01490 family)
MPQSRMSRVAFFDLDHTLLAHNSGVLYARDAHRRGHLSTLDLVRSMVWAGLHFFGRLDVEETYRRAGALFAGMAGDEVRAEVQSWFHGHASEWLRPGGRVALDLHKARAERTVLITNSSGYIAEAAAQAWGMDGWLANDILVDSAGRITGNVSKPLCYGPGKIVRAQRWAEAHGAELASAYFYSDSISDLPLLSRVGSPQVVHPDPRLRRVARQRGWTIHDWSGVPASP